MRKKTTCHSATAVQPPLLYPVRLAVILLAMVGCISVWSGENETNTIRVGESAFPREVAIEGIQLAIHGTSLVRYMYFIKVTANALYLASPDDAENVLDDVPKQLEIYYYLSVPAEKFKELTTTWIARNNSTQRVSRIQKKIRTFNTFYQDVEKGDRYTLSYVPDVGTILALNGEEVGRVGGAEFGRAVFSIWLGPEPVHEKLKRELVKNE